MVYRFYSARRMRFLIYIFFILFTYFDVDDEDAERLAMMQKGKIYLIDQHIMDLIFRSHHHHHHLQSTLTTSTARHFEWKIGWNLAPSDWHGAVRVKVLLAYTQMCSFKVYNCCVTLK
jgi:hypothetical protein